MIYFTACWLKFYKNQQKSLCVYGRHTTFRGVWHKKSNV
eukprot:SAG11_NODE_6122_length_1383_cov_49.687695_3_plen_38_part_01